MGNKTLIILVILVVFAIAILVGFKVVLPEKTVQKPAGETPAATEVNGTLSFELSSTQYQAGETFPVNIIIDSDEQPIIGADIILKYDPSMLEVKAQDGNLVEAEEGFFIAFPAGGQTKEDLFQFSVLTQAPQILKGKVATIYFAAKKTGEAKLEFVFEKGKTNESNLALSGKGIDILASVSEALFQIIK